MKTKPVVGQKLFSLNVGDDCSRYNPAKLTPVIVKKVGRKYFTCGIEDEDWSDEQYNLSDWSQNTNYSDTSRLYFDEQTYIDEQEIYRICDLLDEKFRYGRNCGKKLSLESLKKIEQIIKVEENK